jgi:hypothetical protein
VCVYQVLCILHTLKSHTNGIIKKKKHGSTYAETYIRAKYPQIEPIGLGFKLIKQYY